MGDKRRVKQRVGENVDTESVVNIKLSWKLVMVAVLIFWRISLKNMIHSSFLHHFT